jgi:hypothetical protein
MAGKIVADTLEHSTAGSIATNYVVEGSAKAFSSFTGTAATIGDAVQNSLNISTFTDNGTGSYNYTYTNNFSSVNQVFTAASNIESSTGRGGMTGHWNYAGAGGGQAPTTSTNRSYFIHTENAGGLADPINQSMIIHGDLA